MPARALLSVTPEAAPDTDERESVRLLRALQQTLDAMRESNVRREMTAEKMEEYLRSMDDTITKLATAGQSADANLRVEFGEQRVNLGLLTEAVKADGAAWRKAFIDQLDQERKDRKWLVNRLLLIVVGILGAVGLWRAAVDPPGWLQWLLGGSH